MKISQLGFVFLMFTGACSLRLEPEYKTYYKKEFTWSESQQAIANRKIYNDNKDKTTNRDIALGMLMVIKDVPSKAGMFQLGQCTAFLLDESTLVTNAHCIPKKIRDGQSCENRIYFAYGGSSQNYVCESVLFVHKDFNKEDGDENVNTIYVKPDIAILNIAPVQGLQYFIKSETTIKKDSSLVIRSVDPADLSGSIVFEGRYSANKTFKVADNQFDGSPYRWVEALTELFVVQGNSGSPVLDSITEKVLGVAFASKDKGATLVDFSCLSQVADEWKWKDTCPSISSIRF